MQNKKTEQSLKDRATFKRYQYFESQGRGIRMERNNFKMEDPIFYCD